MRRSMSTCRIPRAKQNRRHETFSHVGRFSDKQRTGNERIGNERIDNGRIENGRIDNELIDNERIESGRIDNEPAWYEAPASSELASEEDDVKDTLPVPLPRIDCSAERTGYYRAVILIMCTE